jgi:hypothetical protein
MLQYLPLQIPKTLSITFLTVGCILVFALWIIAVDQCFVPSDNASQEVTFSVIAIQKVLADIQAYTLVLLCELLGNPHCTTL